MSKWRHSHKLAVVAAADMAKIDLTEMHKQEQKAPPTQAQLYTSENSSVPAGKKRMERSRVKGRTISLVQIPHNRPPPSRRRKTRTPRRLIRHKHLLHPNIHPKRPEHLHQTPPPQALKPGAPPPTPPILSCASSSSWRRGCRCGPDRTFRGGGKGGVGGVREGEARLDQERLP